MESKKEEERRTARSRKVEVDEGAKERSKNKHKVNKATEVSILLNGLCRR